MKISKHIKKEKFKVQRNKLNLIVLNKKFT